MSGRWILGALILSLLWLSALIITGTWGGGTLWRGQSATATPIVVIATPAALQCIEPMHPPGFMMPQRAVNILGVRQVVFGSRQGESPCGLPADMQSRGQDCDEAIRGGGSECRSLRRSAEPRR